MGTMWKPLRRYLETMEGSMARSVDINDIRIMLDIHKTGEIPRNYEEYYNYPVIVLRNSASAELILLANWGTYILRKLRGAKKIKVIVFDDTVLSTGIAKIRYIEKMRNQFIESLKYAQKHNGEYVTTMSISLIKILDSFKRTPPRRIKIDNAKKYMEENNGQDKTIIINSNGELIDGYARYLAAKELDYKYVYVSIMLW